MEHKTNLVRLLQAALDARTGTNKYDDNLSHPVALELRAGGATEWAEEDALRNYLAEQDVPEEGLAFAVEGEIVVAVGRFGHLATLPVVAVQFDDLRGVEFELEAGGESVRMWLGGLPDGSALGYSEDEWWGALAWEMAESVVGGTIRLAD